MNISSRTPEGVPNRCAVCGKTPTVEPSSFPTPDAPCPHCGSLLWFAKTAEQSNASRLMINRLTGEITRLSEENLAPSDYHGELLPRLLMAIAAPAGAVWGKTNQGDLKLEYQINIPKVVCADQGEKSRQTHDELLRMAFIKAQPCIVPPNGDLDTPGNPTSLVVLLAPIVKDKQPIGLIEVWQDPKRPRDSYRGYLQFLVKMAGLAADYARKHAGSV